MKDNINCREKTVLAEFLRSTARTPKYLEDSAIIRTARKTSWRN